MNNQCKSCGYVNGGHVVGCKNDTPGGVPTADCKVCGRKGGHIMPIQDKSVKAYQEDIEAGVDVSGDELMEKRQEELKKAYKAGVEAENKAWVNGTRCATCGKEFIRTEMTDNCPGCWEMN
jgi:hypothetical protein